jgi:hypothetical protein
MEGVKATGYQSNATNFRGVISMSLSNNQLFEKTGRGVYTLRPGAVLEEPDETSGEEQSEQDPAAATAGSSSDDET